ncbi:MAG TPA: RNA chaperone Hfq [Candidatus Polarisedimenticolia bacterium]|nr:RNA chaperone Hfq [Candidatus Polarisedimenticolia bacterium]
MDDAGGPNIQNGFFNQVRKDRTRITIVLTNGQRVSGLVKSFDKFTLLVETRQGDQMVFKHAISTISTFRPSEGPSKGETTAEARGFGNFIDLPGKKVPS